MGDFIYFALWRRIGTVFDLESHFGTADHRHADLRPQDALWRFSPFLWDVAWVGVFHFADLATSVDLRGTDVEDIRLRD